MERCGDEFVTIPPRPSRAAREFAGEQRFEPRLARPQPAHGRDPVKRAGKLDGGDDESELLAAGGPQRGEAFRRDRDREAFFAQDTLDRLAAA